MFKILIVDDDPVMRKLLGKALDDPEMELLYTSDGLYALDILRCNPSIDLLLTDVSMPILDGRQLALAVKGDKRLAHIPILIMSGVVGINAIADLLDAGAEKFIPKPFNMQSVREDVASCLGLKVVMSEV